MNIRLAESKDINQLIRLRWDFTVEYDESKKNSSFDGFENECRTFLENALINNQWFIWVAEKEGKIVSHIYIELIHKVPRPGRVTHPFAYMTNVYTIPEFRNKGIGSEILSLINKWVKENKFEFVIVWPSDESINYYKKNDYVHCSEPMEYFPS
ncbi:GNAT family N-acetyltransferase [Filobacillus milosensis]|uniref:GNAT family N-acetyltransferase n=1 Tax=Filobacillus milosensis TaxID=94137 RepID=A0A4Y8IR49_9BACI|nr:GNAT family N-acetyltransferase [Filobacillus milosensis]TFB24263.1 GNAT family N-acetyltransferase [Filobacillus milosensis]